jgi:ABC-type glycerol-3-phosphate transport system permease component
MIIAQTMAAPSPISRRCRPACTSVAWHLAVVVLALMFAAPSLWLIAASFKPSELVLRDAWWAFAGGGWTGGNYSGILSQGEFARWLLNSIFLCSTQSVLVTLLSSLGGFALAKYQFRGRRLLMLVMLGTLLLPAQVLLPSAWDVTRRLGLLDSYAAIIIPGAVNVFGLLLFKQSMGFVPDELLAAGRVDGCGEFRLWWDIALPCIRPTVSTFALLSFVASWNSFLWPQIVLMSESKYTVAVGLGNLATLPQYRTEYGLMMAGTVLSVLPVIILFLAVHRDFTAGLTAGAVKE